MNWSASRSPGIIARVRIAVFDLANITFSCLRRPRSRMHIFARWQVVPMALPWSWERGVSPAAEGAAAPSV